MKKNNRLKLAALMLILGMLIIDIGINDIKNSYIYHFTDYKQTLADLGSRFNINFDYKINNNFLDIDILDPTLENSAQQMSDFEISRYSMLLPYFFAKYPENIIKNELQAIKLSARLILYGVPYGGTNYKNTIYLTSRGKKKGITDEYIEQTFHHEFSSILMRNYNFPREVWRASNIAEFSYVQSKAERLRAITEGTDRNRSNALYKKGFLTKYAMSTLENDVNVMAEQVFTDPKTIKKLIHQYPIIMEKYKILKDFYLKIDPKFKTIFDAVD